jgi:transposase InsO family protein
VKTERLKRKFIANEKLRNSQDYKAIIHPIKINDIEVRAFFDIGASMTFITEAFLAKLNNPKVARTPKKMRILMGNQEADDNGGTDLVVFNSGTRMCLGTARVLDKLPEAEVYLGRPELFKLGLITLNLPDPLPESMKTKAFSEVAQTLAPEQDDKIDSLTNNNKDKHDLLAEQLKPFIMKNAAITGFAKTPPVTLNLLTPTPKWIPQYEVPHVYHPAIKKQIAKWLDKRKIRVNNLLRRSLWNMPLTAAPKKDLAGKPTGTRVCIDPRYLNKNSIADRFPIPNIKDLVNSLSGNAYFSELDLEDAFLQLKLADGDTNILSFTWEGVQYSFEGCPYGVKTMSSSFQRAMSSIFADMNFVKIYIDNIVVASKTFEEHSSHLRLVLARMNEMNLKISPEKMKLGRSAICLLGMVVSEHGIEADPRKVQQVMDYEFPESCNVLQRFLGVVSYLRPHLRHLSDIEAPLNKARRVSQAAFERELAANEAAMRESFRIIKESIAKAPLLNFPDSDRPFHLATDASHVGIGAVLFQPTQEQIDRQDFSISSDNIIAICSRTLQPYEKEYTTFKLEALGIVNALEQFRGFLFGASFHLHTDHRALTFIFDNKIHHTLGHWLSILLEFDFTVQHVPGLLNILPDDLSRMYNKTKFWGIPNTEPRGREGPPIEELVATLLRNQQETSDETERTTLEASEMAGLISAGQNDTTPLSFNPLREKNVNPGASRRSDVDEYHKLLGRTLVESDSERKKILHECHLRGHFGRKHMIDDIYLTQKLWWPGLRDDIAHVTSTCMQCQRHNVGKSGYHPQRSPTTNCPGDWWQADLIELPPSINGFKYVLAIVDLFSSFLILRPLRTKEMTEVVSVFLAVIGDFGPPIILQSDPGSEFANHLLKELCEITGTDFKISTPKYKGGTGKIERVIGTASLSLKKMLEGAIATWDTLIPICQYYYNISVHSLSRSSPYAILFTRTHNSGGGEKSSWISSDEDISHWIDVHQKRILSDIYPAIAESIGNKRRKRADKFNATHRIVQPVQMGAQVMIVDSDRTSKAQPHNVGPYTVAGVTSTGSYILHDDKNSALIRNISFLRPYTKADGNPEGDIYTVENIVRHKGRRGSPQLRYLIKWKGYPSSENTWEPLENIFDEECIAKYWNTFEKRTPQRKKRKG